MTDVYPRSLRTLGLTLALALPISACSDDDKAGSDTATETDASDDSSDGGDDSDDSDDTGTPSEDDASVGNPEGDPIAIDHDTLVQTVEANLTRHINGLEASLDFLEDSHAIDNLIELFSDDDEEEDDEGDEGDEATKSDEEDEDELDIDLSELRDDIVEVFVDQLMVQSTSTVAEDGLSIFYATDPVTLCENDEDDEEEISEEEAAERLAEQAECEERLGANPLGIHAWSDNEGDVNLTFTIGDTPEDVLSLQLHDDQISFNLEFPKLKSVVEVFVDPEDFELANTMEGVLGVEVRQNASSTYTARFVVSEEVNVAPDDDQEQFRLHLPQSSAPGSITFNGEDQTIDGFVQLAAMHAALPWQIIVDMFYDDETGEINEEGCWVEPEPAPDVDGAFVADLAGVNGNLAYSAADDAFVLTGLGLGDDTMELRVDETTIVQVDVNPDNGRMFDFTFDAPRDDDLGFTLSEDFAARIQLNWERVEDVLDDLPGFMMDDAMGVSFSGSTAPSLHIINVRAEGDEDTQMQMASGQLSLWADSMAEDVFVDEGECMVGIECEEEDGCDDEDEHDLFGGIEGGSCDD